MKRSLDDRSAEDTRTTRTEGLLRTLEEMLPHFLDGTGTIEDAIASVAESIAGVDRTKSATEVQDELKALLSKTASRKRLDKAVDDAYQGRVLGISNEIFPAAERIKSQAQINEAAAEVVRRAVLIGVPEALARKQADLTADRLTREFRSVPRQLDVLKNEITARQFSEIQTILTEPAPDFFRRASELHAVLPDLIPSDAGKEAASILVVEQAKQRLSEHVRLQESISEPIRQILRDEDQLHFLTAPISGPHLGSEQSPANYQAELQMDAMWQSGQKEIPALREKIARAMDSLQDPQEYHKYKRAMADAGPFRHGSQELISLWEGAAAAQRVLRVFDDRLRSAAIQRK